MPANRLSSEIPTMLTSRFVPRDGGCGRDPYGGEVAVDVAREKTAPLSRKDFEMWEGEAYTGVYLRVQGSVCELPIPAWKLGTTTLVLKSDMASAWIPAEMINPACESQSTATQSSGDCDRPSSDARSPKELPKRRLEVRHDDFGIKGIYVTP
ncbi:hypothetical protein B0H19DRAFT_1069446 [Mycena capillaripes]|nr:hypothetical protein B0H19DRAFT_1069446 [Mycena capillaripes]